MATLNEQVDKARVKFLRGQTGVAREALTDVAFERARQRMALIQKRIPHDCADPDVDTGYKLKVLIEEVGEVAEALLEGGDVHTELVQVAAVAVAWAESFYVASERRAA